jgi:hypothetical protein
MCNMIPKKPDDEAVLEVTPLEELDDGELRPDEEIVEDDHDDDE